MSDVKWIKLSLDMFENDKIDFISTLPEADAILVIWVRLLTLAGKCNAGGYVFLTEKIPYTDEMLSNKLRKPLNVVKLALQTFVHLDMIDMDEQGIFLPNWEKYQSIETLELYREREKVRKQEYRLKKRLEKVSGTLSGTNEGQSHESPRLEVEEELDKEKELSSTATTADVYETVSDVYSKVFGGLIMKPLISDYIKKLLNAGYSEHFIKELLYEVGESSANPNLRLLEKIGERWQKENIVSRDDNRKRKEAEFNAQHKGRAQVSGHGGNQTPSAEESITGGQLGWIGKNKRGTMPEV